MTIYFTSDHHFDHKNIIKYCNRPFDSIEEMNEELIKRWNEKVSKNDIVYYLGDFSLSFTAVEKYLPKLNGKKYLINGNHDYCYPMHPKSNTHDKQLQWCDKYIEAGFFDVLQSEYIFIDKQDVLMMHLPYLNTEFENEKYSRYRPIDTGDWLLHGHVHNTWKVKDKMINVGVDVWDYYPVSLEEIIQVINHIYV